MFTLKKWDPFRDLATLKVEMDDIFKRAFGNLGPIAFSGGWNPSLESFVEDGKLKIKADLPGVDPSDVEVSIEGDHMTIRGVRKVAKEEEEAHHYFSELCYGAFERVITLPEGVETDGISATFTGGVLEVTMPAKPSSSARKISVEIKEGTKGKGREKKAA